MLQIIINHNKKSLANVNEESKKENPPATVEIKKNAS